MGETINSLAGTEAGGLLALALALLAALSHAVFGAINKGGADPFINRGAINLSYGLMAAPAALFIVPWPDEHVWPILALSWVVHLVYEYFQAASFERGAFTVVYPIARGTGPLLVALMAGAVFGEHFTLGQWGGVLLLSSAIFGLAWSNIAAMRSDLAGSAMLRSAIWAALGTGVMIAVYTTVDAYGIRLAADPFTYLAWFYFLGGFGFPFISYRRWVVKSRPELNRGELAIRGFAGGLIAFLSFGSLMLATRLDSVGEAAALRETSIIFGAAIGVLIFREQVTAARFGLILLIALGAVLVEFGG